MAAPTNDTRRQALAERFGMTPDAVERLLTDTHSEYSSGPVSEPETPPPAAKPPHTSAGGGLTAAILVALFVVLGITMSFNKGCFEQRNHAHEMAKKQVDTIQSMMNSQAQVASTPPVTPTEVGPNDVPPELLVAPKETPGAS